MGSQAKNNLQICFHASANRRKERDGGGGGDVGGRRASFSSTALTRTFKVNLRSVSVHAEFREKKKFVSLQTRHPLREMMSAMPFSELDFCRIGTVDQQCGDGTKSNH